MKHVSCNKQENLFLCLTQDTGRTISRSFVDTGYTLQVTGLFKERVTIAEIRKSVKSCWLIFEHAA